MEEIRTNRDGHLYLFFPTTKIHNIIETLGVYQLVYKDLKYIDNK